MSGDRQALAKQRAAPQLVATTLAYVRTGDGQVVEVDRGESVPAGADSEHVTELQDKGVLVTSEQLAELDQHDENEG